MQINKKITNNTYKIGKCFLFEKIWYKKIPFNQLPLNQIEWDE